MMDTLREELEQMRSKADAELARLAQIEAQLKDREHSLALVARSVDQKLSGMIEKDLFVRYFQKPYVVIPQAKHRVLVAVPKFISNFQVGWLWKETETFYIYQLDQYSAWLSDIPKELLAEIDFKKEVTAIIEEDVIKFEPAEKETVKRKLGHHLKDFSENEARVVRGHEFDLTGLPQHGQR